MQFMIGTYCVLASCVTLRMTIRGLAFFNEAEEAPKVSELLSRLTSAWLNKGQPSAHYLSKSHASQMHARQRAIDSAPTRLEAVRAHAGRERSARSAELRIDFKEVKAPRTPVRLFGHVAHHVLDSRSYPLVDLAELLVRVCVGLGRGGSGCGRGGSRFGLGELRRVQLAAVRIATGSDQQSAPVNTDAGTARQGGGA